MGGRNNPFVIIAGPDGSKASVGTAGTVLVADFNLEVAKGNVPGHSLVRKFGAINDLEVDTDSDVYEYGSIGTFTEKYIFSPDGVADITLMSSSDNGDTVTMTIQGLDAAGEPLNQDVALTGQTPVAITAMNRVNRAFNSNGTPLAGNVYIYTTGTTVVAGVPQAADEINVRAYINATDSQTLQGIYSVPVNCKAYIQGLEVSLTHAGSPAGTVNLTCKGIVQEFGKIARTQDEFDLIHRGSSIKTYNFPSPLPFLGRSDFIPQVRSNTAAVGATWSYTILLIQDGF